MLAPVDELAVRIGANIKAARVRAKLSQGKLAEAVDASLRGVQQWESGERRCSLEALHRVANALGVKPGCLLEDPSAAKDIAGRRELVPFCDSVAYDADVPLATQHDEPATRADIARLEARLDALTRLLEERLPR